MKNMGFLLIRIQNFVKGNGLKHFFFKTDITFNLCVITLNIMLNFMSTNKKEN